MSRAVVISAITSDPQLLQDFDKDNVKSNFDGDQRPSDKMFLSLNWGAHSIDRRMRRGPRELVIWVHMWRKYSTDYDRIDRVIERLDDVLTNIIDTPGADGQTVTLIEAGDKSRDLKDRDFDTLCRSASYRVLSRKT